MAFGAVYPWAYTPLLVASASLGITAIAAGRAATPRALTVTLGAIAAAAAVQLLPLAEGLLATISPNALTIHQQRNLLAATGAAHSLTLTIDPQQTALALAFVVALSLLLVGGVRFVTRETAARLATGIAAIGVALAITALIQRITYDGKIYGFWETQQRSNPFGPFVNRNHFAGWMLMAVPLAIGLLARHTTRGLSGVPTSVRERVLWFATPEASKAILAAFAVTVMALSLVLTLSRSGITAMAFAMLFASVVIARRIGPGRRRLIIPIFLAGVVIVAILWVGVDRIAGRFSAPGLIDAAGRRAIWSAAGRMIDDFWLTGTGLNTFGVASLYYPTPLAGVHVREAHNDYLQLAAEGGLLLGVPIVAALVVLILGIRRRLAIDQGSIWWVRVGAVTGLLAVASQSVVEFSLQIPGNAVLFTIVCAIALHDSGRRVRRRSDADAEEPPSTDRLWTSRDDVDLSALDPEPQPQKRPAKFPFRAGIYYQARHRVRRRPSSLGVAALLMLLLFFLLLLALFGEGAPLQ